MLFSYGTLQQKEVQCANFGRELIGEPAVLQGYVVTELKIRDARVIAESGKDIHPILCYTGKAADEVQGTVFALTPQELAQADDYEVYDYQRVRATLRSGMSCWIYAARADK